MKRAWQPPQPGVFRPALWLKGALLAGGLAALWLGLNYRTLGAYFVARVHRNENKLEVLQLERQLADLSQEKRQLETGGFSAEKTLRERFKLARPGETVILLEEPRSAPATSGAESPQR